MPLEDTRLPNNANTIYKISEKIHINDTKISILELKVDTIDETLKANTILIQQIHETIIKTQGASWGVGKVFGVIVGSITASLGAIKWFLMIKGS